jgi:hypothetical protein
VPLPAAPKGLGSSRGKDIHQAAREGNVGAVRHFLHVEPGRMKWAAASEPKLELRSRSTPSINWVCFGEVRLGKGSNRPTWVLTVWHHQIAVEALEGPRQTFILLSAANFDSCI